MEICGNCKHPLVFHGGKNKKDMACHYAEEYEGKIDNECNCKKFVPQDLCEQPILWMRKLSCGHSRPTNLAFISKKYVKPKVGEICYCRQCFKEVKVVGVERCEEGGENGK